MGEEASSELLGKVSSLKERLGASQEPSGFLKNILVRVLKIWDEFPSFHGEFKSTAFAEAARCTAKLRYLLYKIQVYDLMLCNLGWNSMDVSKEHPQDPMRQLFSLEWRGTKLIISFLGSCTMLG